MSINILGCTPLWLMSPPSEELRCRSLLLPPSNAAACKATGIELRLSLSTMPLPCYLWKLHLA